MSKGGGGPSQSQRGSGGWIRIREGFVARPAEEGVI